MRVCVVGVGAIGGLFAAHLATDSQVDVFAYDVNSDQVDAINASGLQVVGCADFRVPLKATTDISRIPLCDYGIVATKAEHTAAAIDDAAVIFRDAAVVSIQNGIGNEQVIARHVSKVIRGTTFLAGALVRPGVVRLDAFGETWLGPFEPKPAAMSEIEALARALTRGGCPTYALDDANGWQWTKFIFNTSTNPLGALTGLSIGQLCDLPDLRAAMSNLIKEGIEVAQAVGITLESHPEELVEMAAQSAYAHKASMLQDIRARRSTEVATLNEAIVGVAKELGIEAPLNEFVAALIRGLEYASRTVSADKHVGTEEL